MWCVCMCVCDLIGCEEVEVPYGGVTFEKNYRVVMVSLVGFVFFVWVGLRDDARV